MTLPSHYRTLIRGRLRQDSSLTVGGSPAQPGDPDIVCARDGRGQPILPGTGLAGALIQTAARVFPELFAPKATGYWRRITGKQDGGPPEKTWQSLWRFRPSHRTSAAVELRQGVGIRQATGAAAAEAKALYDIETLPPGENWDFFLDVDRFRGGAEVEAVALHALAEWAEGRCWLGAGAARGLGWMTLENCEVLRLPATRAAFDAWPDNSRPLDDVWADLVKLKREDGDHQERADLRALAGAMLALPAEARWCYLEIRGAIVAGRRDDGYGIDALSVGGHAIGSLDPPRGDAMLRPRGVEPQSFAARYDPDVALAATGDPAVAFIPGSGVRGPLRHAASRIQRGRGEDVVDPNQRDASGVPKEKSDDSVSRLFGLVGQDGRLLVCDARPEGAITLACFQHHAEDEFAGSVFGSGKFDRTMVIDGRFPFRLVLEAGSELEMREHLAVLAPALGLAELGFVPAGGAKTRGAGGGRWKITAVRRAVAGAPWEAEQTCAGPGEWRRHLTLSQESTP
jgi:CRISPR/Cas system CSM-associated protein Csm3 (group 7 of RAMP superfamily)